LCLSIFAVNQSLSPVCFILMCITTLSVRGAIILCLLFAVGQAGAETPKKCTPTEAKRARAEAGHLQDWSSVYSSFKTFGHCDSGKIAEEYSYAISRLLAHHWNDVELLLGLAASDADFKQFVLRHINEDIPEEEAQLIINNSRQHCPPAGKWLCDAIADY
jgi:hypothetical protein